MAKKPSGNGGSGIVSEPIMQSIEKGKTFGPVKNLEDYVQSDWWRKIFNAYYLKTDADVVGDDNITKSEIEYYIKVLNPQKYDLILDICCGQGRHCFEFYRRGFEYVTGLDRSHYLIQRAKKQNKQIGSSINFKEGDARKLPFPDNSFDIITILGNSFGYFDNIQDDLKVLRDVFRILKPQGKLLIDVTDGEYVKKHFLPRSWEWIDANNFVCRERSLSADHNRLISREVITHAQKGVTVDQFYAERLYTQEGITDLLKTSGFDNVSFHGVVETDSQRNQDLGMMERRLIMTATAKKAYPTVGTKAKKKLKNVAVILGDPGKKDILKPSQMFDDDDFYTVNQLKKVLMNMKDYNFLYFDNHSILIQEMLKNKMQLSYAFNLCDEGYNNNAFHELHVPALLEMLGIPYTGSGPQCLSYCYDKSLVRGIAREMGINVPEAFFIKPDDNIYGLPFPFPVLVKPNYGDSSFGITQRSYAESFEDIVNAIDEVRNVLGMEKPILVEEFLPGKDITIGIIGNAPDNYTFLPIIEEDYSILPDGLPKICGYEAKWMPDSPYWNLKSVLANLPEETEKYIEESCLKLANRLGCRDYARFDWRLDKDGNPKLLEVNPNPGWCWDGHLARMANLHNMTYGDMVKQILTVAENRLKIE